MYHTTTYFFVALDMPNFLPENYDLRSALIFRYRSKKTAEESRRMTLRCLRKWFDEMFTSKEWQLIFFGAAFTNHQRRGKNVYS